MTDQPLHLNYIEPIIIDLLRLNEFMKEVLLELVFTKWEAPTFLETNDLSYIIETFKLRKIYILPIRKGLKIDVYDDILKPLNMLSPYKLLMLNFMF